MEIILIQIVDIVIYIGRGRPFSAYVKFSEKLTLFPPWYVHLRVRIRG